jgi:hypothetical protein
MSFNSKESKSSSHQNTTGYSDTITNSNYNTQSDRNYTDRNWQGPWNQQAPHLQNIFGAAQDMFNQSQGDANQLTRDAYWRAEDAFGGMYDQATHQGQQMEDRWNNLQGQQQQATQRYNQLTDEILQQGMGDFQQQAADFAGQNPYLDQAIDQSWDNANQMLDQQVGGAGGIDHSASQGGNMSSSRAGVAEGLATAEMADRGQQNELALRQAAYDQGLGQANQLHQGRMNMAGMMEQNPAEMARLLQGQQGSQAGYQGMQSGALQGQMGAAEGHEQSMWNPVNNYMNIIGANNWGSEGTQSGYSSENRQKTGYAESHTDRAGTSTGSGRNSSSGWGVGLGDIPTFFGLF